MALTPEQRKILDGTRHTSYGYIRGIDD